MSSLKTPILLLSILLLASCRWLPFMQDDEDAPPPPAPDQAESTVAAVPASLGRVIGLLQDGEAEVAERLLVDILERRPGDATARLMLAQIRQPPEELLGDDFTEILVEPGDSLSRIAGRHIDNELLFYSLARLNGIDRPRLLRPGQRLKVPALEPLDEQVEAVGPEQQIAPADRVTQPRQLERAVDDLVARERHAQAYALLLSAARAGRMDESMSRQLTRVSMDLAGQAEREGDPERALKYLNQAAPWLGTSAETGPFAAARAEAEARLLMIEADQRLAAGDQDAALDAWLHARELVPDGPAEQQADWRQLQLALGQYYHDQALSAWRLQQVDRSAELWERVLQIDPEFEPARVYLERARRVQAQLQGLDESG